MALGDFQEFLGRERLWLPLDPLWRGKGKLGGILATNSAGPLRLRFGSARDMVLGIRVATTEGKLIKSGGRVVKNVAGYDLCKLLVGSYGTLGVIVEASFKLFPRPASRATSVLEAGDARSGSRPAQAHPELASRTLVAWSYSIPRPRILPGRTASGRQQAGWNFG